ncbi:MAG: PEP-CTERM sorting domain-containing protein [bacterium]|nr:PEP-CTERM sorting domain-containing protein [bacterium]
MSGIHTRVSLAVAVLVCAVSVGSAAHTYVADFDTDAEGWNGAYGVLTWRSSGGVGDSGYIESSRDGYLSTFYPDSPAARAEGCGDLGATYGNLIRFSYYIKRFQNATQAATHSFIDNTYAGSSVGGYWLKTTVGDPTPLTDWTFVTFDIDTTWTDAQAVANGWTRPNAAPLSWADTCSDIKWNYHYYGDGVLTGHNITGVDEVRIESVPEPASAAIFVLGACSLLRKRRAAR